MSPFNEIVGVGICLGGTPLLSKLSIGVTKCCAGEVEFVVLGEWKYTGLA